MPNFFDQFDKQAPAQGGNFFDQFQPAQRQPLQPPKDFSGRLADVWEKPAPGGLVSLVKAAVSGASLPGDVYSGKTPLRDADGNISQDVINRSGELAGIATPMTPGMRAGEGVLGANAGDPRIPLKPPAPPTMGQIKDEAIAGFQSPEVKELLLDPKALVKFSDEAKKSLLKGGDGVKSIPDLQAPKVYGLLDKIKNSAESKMGDKFDTPITYEDVRAYRDWLASEAGDNSINQSGNERLAGALSKYKLDNTFSNLTPDMVIRGDVTKAAPILQTANKNFSTAERMGDFSSKMREAEINSLTSKDLASEQRKQAKSILLSDERKNLGLKEDDISALERLAHGGFGENLKRYTGEALAPKGLKGLAAAGTLGTLGLLTGGGALGAIALPLAAKGVGTLLKGSAAKNTARNVQNVLSTFSRKSPLYNSMTRK